MSSADFLIGAPKFITNRFNSVSKYVWETLYPEHKIKKKIKNIKNKNERKKEIDRLREISNEASTVVFLFLINKFFIEGSKAAKDAVDTFKELGIEGFFIGRSYFSDRNEKVIQGDLISMQLLDSINNEKIKELVLKSKYIYEILENYKKIS